MKAVVLALAAAMLTIALPLENINTDLDRKLTRDSHKRPKIIHTCEGRPCPPKTPIWCFDKEPNVCFVDHDHHDDDYYDDEDEAPIFPHFKEASAEGSRIAASPVMDHNP